MGIKTERLYYADSFLSEFTSKVVDVCESGNETWVRLEETAFYPTSGGQPHDTGEMAVAGEHAARAVTDVEVDEGHVWHRIEGHLGIGQSITGRIDWARRFDFMQQHSGQHILSACFDQMLGANTSSFHMGDTAASIDLDVAELPDEQVRQVMIEANRWIWQDVPVRARFVTEQELAHMRLRKAPSVAEDIRIVTVEGLEDNACGGTHVSSSGQVGQILITKTEHVQGGVRATFVCGGRALAGAKGAVDTVRLVAAGFSVKDTELLDAAQALQNQAKESRRAYRAMRNQYNDLLARDLAAQHTRCIEGTHVLRYAASGIEEMQEIKQLAASCAACIATAHPHDPCVVILVGELGGRTSVVIQATDGAIVRADELIKRVLPDLNGKGGGNARAAQGSAPTPVQQVLDAFASAIPC